MIRARMVGVDPGGEFCPHSSFLKTNPLCQSLHGIMIVP